MFKNINIRNLWKKIFNGSLIILASSGVLILFSMIIVKNIIGEDIKKLEESSRIKISEILTAKDFLNYITNESPPLISIDKTITYLNQDAKFIKKYILENNILPSNTYKNNFIDNICARGYLLNIQISQYPKEIDCERNYINYYLDDIEVESEETILENINNKFSK